MEAKCSIGVLSYPKMKVKFVEEKWNSDRHIKKGIISQEHYFFSASSVSVCIEEDGNDITHEDKIYSFALGIETGKSKKHREKQEIFGS